MDMLADPQPLADGLAALRAWLAREFSSPSIIAQTAAIAAAGGLAMLVAPRLQGLDQNLASARHTESRLGQPSNTFIRRLTLALLPLLVPFVALFCCGRRCSWRNGPAGRIRNSNSR